MAMKTKMNVKAPGTDPKPSGLRVKTNIKAGEPSAPCKI